MHDANGMKESRYAGCLLGGAVGDALGYPVEFMDRNGIEYKYGPEGIRTLAQAGSPARISDDTQMTLFAANGLLYGLSEGIPMRAALWTAYREWLGTQGDVHRMDDPAHPKMWLYREPRLHARRVPGNTCLSSISGSRAGGTPDAPVNNSRGCGSVMRAAPFGLAVKYDPGNSQGGDAASVYELAVCDGALTHGHPMGYLSSAGLALIVWEIVQRHPERDCPLEERILSAGALCGDALRARLERAVALAKDDAVPDLKGVFQLGEGWTADEALLIAVFCAVRHQDDFAAGVRAAVNHSGDSDSTGAICGNILGAWLGREAVEAAFDLNDLELRDVIEAVAADLFRGVEDGIARLPADAADDGWNLKYRRGGEA